VATAASSKNQAAAAYQRSGVAKHEGDEHQAYQQQQAVACMPYHGAGGNGISSVSK